MSGEGANEQKLDKGDGGCVFLFGKWKDRETFSDCLCLGGKKRKIEERKTRGGQLEIY